MFHVIKNLLADHDNGTMALLSDLAHENAEFLDRFTGELSRELDRTLEGRGKDALSSATRRVLERLRRQPAVSSSLRNVISGLLELAFDPFIAESDSGKEGSWADELPEGILWLVAQRVVETGRAPAGLAGHPLFPEAPGNETFPSLLESTFDFLPADPDPKCQQAWMADPGLVNGAVQALQRGESKPALFRAMAKAGYIPGKTWQTLDPPELVESGLGEWKKLVAAILNLAWRKPEEASRIEGLDLQAAATGRLSWTNLPLPEEDQGMFLNRPVLIPAHHFARMGYPVDLAGLSEENAEQVLSVGSLTGVFQATADNLSRLAKASKLSHLPLFHALAFSSDPEEDTLAGMTLAPGCEALKKFRLQYLILPLQADWGIRNWVFLDELLDRPDLLDRRVHVESSAAPGNEPTIAEVIVAAAVRSKGSPSAETEKVCRMVLAHPGSWRTASRSIHVANFGSIETEKLFRGRAYPLPLALFLNAVQPDRHLPPDVVRGLLEAGMRAWPGDPLQLADCLTRRESWNETVSLAWYDLSDEQVVELVRREIARRSLSAHEENENEPIL
jgi:hypothetical protein